MTIRRRDGGASRLSGATAVLLLASSILLSPQCVESQCVTLCGESSQGWNALVRVTATEARTVSISWSPDTVMSTTNYSVQYRLISGVFNFEHTTNTTFTIVGLMPSSEYEVQVCRPETNFNTENCGNCLLCFTTDSGGPPTAPRDVEVTIPSPTTISVRWAEPSLTNGLITNYIVNYTNVMTGVTLTRTTGSGDVFFRLLNGLSQNTSYRITVQAENQDGISIGSDIVIATTLPLSNVPGALLFAQNGAIQVATINEDVITNFQTQFMSSISTLSSSLNSTVTDIDFHYRRAEVYCSLSTGEIQRFSVSVMELTGALNLTMSSMAETVVVSTAAGEIRSITVDWVNDRGYYLLQNGGEAQIYRFNLDNNVTSRVGLPLTGQINSLTVDPFHGFLYWVIINQTVSRITIGAAETASASTDLIALAQVFLNSSTIGTFTIDLADSQYFYQRSGQIVRDNLGGGSQTLLTNPATSILQTFVSYGDVPILYTPAPMFLAFFVLNPGVNVEPNIPGVTAMALYRSVRQPLPVPPEAPRNLNVDVTNNSAVVTWDRPLYSSSLFSSTAFSSWQYFLTYRAVSGSDPTDTLNTTSTTLTLTQLTPSTLYQLTITARGPAGDEQTTEKFVFVTLNEGELPKLILASNQGLLQTNLQATNERYISRTQSDNTRGLAHNSQLDIYYWVTPTLLYRQQYDNGTPTRIFSAPRDVNVNLRLVSLDWIGRRLYWVEQAGSMQRINSIDTTLNFPTDPNSIELFVEDTIITDVEVDSLTGLVFWASGNQIKMRAINKLFSYPSLTLSEMPKALAVDSANGNLYSLAITSADITLVYQVSFNHNGFTTSPVNVTLSQLSLSTNQDASLVYASGKLYITQTNSITVYSFAADIATISNSSFIPIVADVRPTIADMPPEEYRAVSVIFADSQPLPANLTAAMTGMVRPGLPASPRLGSSSTINTTFIEWTSSPELSYSPIFYRVSYDLTRFNGSMENGSQSIEGTAGNSSIVLVNQTFHTKVVVSILAYTLWQPADAVVTGEFFSVPRPPVKVQNVRVFVFFPHRDVTVAVAGKVVWDRLTQDGAGGTVDMYRIVLRDDNNQVPSMVPDGGNFTVPGTNAEFILTQVLSIGLPQYFLDRNMNYTITVQAINSAGIGTPSTPVEFTTDAVNPPLEVFLVGSGGGAVTGEFASSSMPQPSLTPPLAINTQSNTIYYYNSFAINSSSLDGRTSPQMLTTFNTSASFVPLSMTYDWIAQVLYLVGRTATRIEMWKIIVVAPSQQSLVHSYELSQSPPEDLEMGITVNPFSGFIHWTQYSPADPSISSLYQLNLRGNAVTQLISAPAARRRRRRSLRRRKRQVPLSSVQLTAAIVLDPFTNSLLVSDASSGNILSCNTTSSPVQCNVAVDSSQLTGAPSGALPAIRIAVDETRIYWTSNSTMGVHYVLKSDTPSVAVETIPSNTTAGILLSTSPGLQQLPGNGRYVDGPRVFVADCLSPAFMSFDTKPVPRVVMVTNATAMIEWDEPSLMPSCEGVVFSVSPYQYRIMLHQQGTGMQNNLAENIPPIFGRSRTLVDLLPFTEYRVSVEARNMYTSTTNNALFGTEVTFRTAEGVPNDISSLQAFTFGTRQAVIEFTPLNTKAQLRGFLENQTAFVFNDENFVEEISVPTAPSSGSCCSIVVKNLTPDTNNAFQVLVSNRVLNSSRTTSNSVTTWPLPPTPMLTNVTNRTLTFTLPLEDRHSNITSLMVQINQTQVYPVNFTTSGPSNITGNFTGLNPNTVYRVSAIARYQTVTVGNMTRDNITEMSSYTTLTEAGIPDSPTNLVLDDSNFLTWDAPDGNGQEITFYYIIYRSNSSVFSEPHVAPSTRERLAMEDLMQDEDYSITVLAHNDIGNSSESGSISYTRQPPLSTAAIIGIASGSAAAVLLLFFIIIVICCCYCCCCPSRKSQYTFGEDYELNRLRALSAAKHGAQNPHYLWSREDFIASDDDLENLHKFPRNRLHLEMFIARGEFGEVYQGSALDILGQGTGPTPVAVKTLRKGSTTDEQRKFLSEAALMFNFNHQNIVKVLGICVDNDPLYIIMELMPAGDLLGYLREAKTDNGPTLLTHPELLQISVDVSNGCRYLEQQHFIHRDIAARNCLVSSKGADRVVKIGDFGLAKDLYSSDYYQVEGQRKLPVRWMAPEALLQGKFTIESDIWSFGILLWEIMTLGNQPYPGMNNQEVLQYVTGGGRLDKPDNCPGKIYRLMQNCWRKYASERPHFSEIVDHLAQYLDHLNNKRDSYYSEDDSDEEGLNRRPSRSRTPSLRSGFMNLARQGSMKLRHSFRRRSIHRKEENDVTQDEEPYRERGPF